MSQKALFWDLFFEGRVLCQARIDREDLVVVYIEIPQGVLVVTAYWKGTI